MIEYIFVNFFDALIKCSSSIYALLDIHLVHNFYCVLVLAKIKQLRKYF